MKTILVLASLLIVSLTYAQQPDIGSKVVYNLKDGTILKGTLIQDGPISSEITIFNGDTLEIGSELVESRYAEVNKVFSLAKGRYHYKSGFHIDLSTSLGAAENGGHTNIELSFNKRVTEKLSLGFGLSNQLDQRTFQPSIATNNTWVFINHKSTPIFIQGKYFLNTKRKRFYVHGRTGYSIGRSRVWDNSVRNNGFIAQYGIGLNKATKHGIRTFIQLNQSNSYGSGQAVVWSRDGQLPQFDYNIWFNRISMTFGMEVNLQRKNRKF